MAAHDQEALAAAVAVATAHGLRVVDPVVLGGYLETEVLLRPAPVVARVVGPIRSFRPGTAWVKREVAVAGHLARVGAPVVAPSSELPPGPHEHAGRVVSFWEHVEGATDPAVAGAALRACHEALRDYKGALPPLGGLTEAEALNARLVVEHRIAPEVAAEWQRRFDELRVPLGELRSPVQPLHGNAHLGNVRAGRWSGWQETCLGPVAWDAACLLESEGDGRAALAATGLRPDPGELSLWVEARRLQVAAWVAWLSS